jgi:hypothetical protein
MSVKTVGPSLNIAESLLRPNNTTQYTAGDVIADTVTGVQVVFANMARYPGGSGTITDAILTSSANETTKGEFELWLFDTINTAHEADNAAFSPTDNDMVRLAAILDFTTVFEATAGAGGNVAYMAERTFLPISFKCVAASRNLFATLVVRNAYTPIAFEVFTFRLNVEQD